MSGFVAGAMVVSTAVAIKSTSDSNKRADEIADNQNYANTEAANRSISLSEKDNADRKAELLRRFNIKNSKIADTANVINTATAHKLTNINMQMTAARSATTNNLATKGITGRLAERLRAVQSVKGSQVKDSVLQGQEAELKAIGDKLETQAMDFESENLNLNIELGNAINAANNQQISNYAYSASTGTAGVFASGIGGAARGVALGKSAEAAFS